MSDKIKSLSKETLEGLYIQKNNEYNELLLKYSKLLRKYEELEKEINKLTAHNSRGAGRKSKFSDVDIESMKFYRLQGKTTREIAELYGCSHVTVSKLIK